MVGSVWELRRGAGDAVARIGLRGRDNVAVDVTSAVDRVSVERYADDVRCAGSVLGGRDAERDAVQMPGIAGGEGGGVGVALVDEGCGVAGAVDFEGVADLVAKGRGRGGLEGVVEDLAGDGPANGTEIRAILLLLWSGRFGEVPFSLGENGHKGNGPHYTHRRIALVEVELDALVGQILMVSVLEEMLEAVYGVTASCRPLGVVATTVG
jgi:hypothetical protein